MIEKPPHTQVLTLSADDFRLASDAADCVNRLLDEYAYWSDVKYKRVPGFPDPEGLWSFIKTMRKAREIDVCAPFGLHFSLTNRMAELCHAFDMKFGGSWGSESLLPRDGKQRFLVGSVMEEAISSSQMEGASTTRRVAKEMLRKNTAPRDKSQQMIYNNYHTIRYLSEHTGEPLTEELILKIHSLMTESTLDNPEDCGRFRVNDEVVVENAVTHEVVHTPPHHSEIPKAISWLVRFANGEAPGVFIHPVIKAVVIHFFISYLHPLVDGNGRTARALFHWYMLREGYWLTEYMSISRIIYSSKSAYEKSFLRVEADGNDMGYFITYHINALDRAFGELKEYVSRKTAQRSEQNRLLKMGNITQRQAEIIYMMLEDADRVLTVRDISSRMLVTATTAKRDIIGLVEQGLLEEIALNRQKKGYVRGPEFEARVEGVL